MHSQLPTISLYLNSYARSPPKYNNESTLMASPNNYRMAAQDSSIISPLKDQQPTRDRNLSSLILMATPAKPPLKEKQERGRESGREDGAEVTALNLSANIFMNSTTKFLKTFPNLNHQITSKNLQQKTPPLNQRGNTKVGEGKQQSPNIEEKSGKFMPLASRYVRSTDNAAPISYPSKEKIEKLMKGESTKKGQNNSSLMMRKTLNRMGRNSSQANLNPGTNRSLSQRSRSGSVQRLERRRSRIRQLKFMEKRERSQTSITLKHTQKDAAVKIDLKTRNNIRPIINEAKSSGNKRTEETIRTNNKNNNVRPLPYVVTIDKKIEKNPSILSNTSETQGFRPIFTLPSGELPLETPIKPPPALQPSSNTSNDPTSKPNKVKPHLPSQISVIRQEKTSHVHSKPSVKSKQLVFHGSAKEEASTYVHENPTEVAVCNDGDAVSKLSKNQSTKALGLSTVYKNYYNKHTKQQQRVELSKNEPLKPVLKKTQSSKIIHLEPIPSSPSILSDRKSSMVSALSKRNIKTEPKEEMQQKITVQQPSVQLASNKGNELSPLLKKSSHFLFHVMAKFMGSRVRDGLQGIKRNMKNYNIHKKEAVILAEESLSLYRVLYSSNMRGAFGQLKKLSLSNPIHKKPSLSLNSYKPHAINIIFRVLTSKYRQSYNSFRNNICIKKYPPTITNQPTKPNNPLVQNKEYIIQSSFKILQGYYRMKVKKGLEKLILFSNSKKKQVHKQSIPASRSISKMIKPMRDYQGQKLALNNEKQSIQSDIQRLQWRLSQKKRSSDREKGKLIKKQQDLQSKGKALNQEVLDRQHKNKSLKLSIQQSASTREMDTSLPECESFVDILTEIYTAIFKSKEQTINIAHIIDKYSLSKEYQSPIQQQWQAMALNTALKSSIEQWQGRIPPHHPKQLLLSQQSLIVEVLRNYIRERYLWHYFHTAAENLSL